jgi:hypothetical protein
VDDAITAVVMSPRGIANELHSLERSGSPSITAAVDTAKDGRPEVHSPSHSPGRGQPR